MTVKEDIAEAFAYILVGLGVFATIFILVNLPIAVNNALQTPEIQTVLAKQRLTFFPIILQTAGFLALAFFIAQMFQGEKDAKNKRVQNIGDS